MSRPVKSGLDYFPLDVDYFSDMKIRRMQKACGPLFSNVFLYLLCMIYRDGYYIRWSEDLCFLISDATGVDESFVEKAIERAMFVDLLDQAMFDEHKILTSRGIQKRYLQIIGQCRRKGGIASQYDLLKITSEETGVSAEDNTITAEENGVNSEETANNVEFGTQRKLNKIKVNYNESKSNKITAEDFPPGFLEFAELYPKKKGLWETLEAWKEVNAGEHIDEIMASLRAYMVSEDWQKQGGQFIQQPANWLRRRLWESGKTLGPYCKTQKSDPFLDALRG